MTSSPDSPHDHLRQARVLRISPERLERWLDGFQERHGAASLDVTPTTVRLAAPDGAEATCEVPFPPLARDDTAYGGLLTHTARERRVGVLLVRRGGYAAGVFDGTRLVASKVGSRHVQGRSAAGGQSQQRFARRREKQAREAFEAAADVAARILLPYADTLEAAVTGGDRTAVDRVLADRRLAVVRGLVVGPNLSVPDPRLAVLEKTPTQFRAVQITVSEPG